MHTNDEQLSSWTLDLSGPLAHNTTQPNQHQMMWARKEKGKEKKRKRRSRRAHVHSDGADRRGQMNTNTGAAGKHFQVINFLSKVIRHDSDKFSCDACELLFTHTVRTQGHVFVGWNFFGTPHVLFTETDRTEMSHSQNMVTTLGLNLWVTASFKTICPISQAPLDTFKRSEAVKKWLDSFLPSKF